MGAWVKGIGYGAAISPAGSSGGSVWGWAGPTQGSTHPLLGVLSSIFLCLEGRGGGAQSTDPTDGFYLQPLRLVCARLLTYFEELEGPAGSGEPPTSHPLTHDLARDQMGGSGPVEIGSGGGKPLKMRLGWRSASKLELQSTDSQMWHHLGCLWKFRFLGLGRPAGPRLGEWARTLRLNEASR